MCNLASIAVNMYVDEKKKTFDFAKFREVIKVMVRNLNRIIDINYYPVDEVSGKMLSYAVFEFSYIFLTDLTMFFLLETQAKYSEAYLTLTCTFAFRPVCRTCDTGPSDWGFRVWRTLSS